MELCATPQVFCVEQSDDSVLCACLFSIIFHGHKLFKKFFFLISGFFQAELLFSVLHAEDFALLRSASAWTQCRVARSCSTLLCSAIVNARLAAPLTCLPSALLTSAMLLLGLPTLSLFFKGKRKLRFGASLAFPHLRFRLAH